MMFRFDNVAAVQVARAPEVISIHMERNTVDRRMRTGDLLY